MLGIEDRTLTRWVAVLSCGYLLWAFAALWRYTVLFRNLVAGLGADTPASTGFLFDHYVWFYPLLYLVLTTILVGQHFFVDNDHTRLTITLVVSLLAIFVIDFLKSLLYLPVLGLVNQLS